MFRTLISSSLGSSLSAKALASASRAPLTPPTNTAEGRPVTARAIASALRGASEGAIDITVLVVPEKTLVFFQRREGQPIDVWQEAARVTEYSTGPVCMSLLETACGLPLLR